MPPNGGGNRRLSERGVAAALRSMDEAGERSRRNVVAYLNIGVCTENFVRVADVMELPKLAG